MTRHVNDPHLLAPVIRSTGIKATRASQLTGTLRTAILSGAMKPGEKVALDRLRDQHQVSLSPLREAISRLASSGLIDMQDQRGYLVAPVSQSNLSEILALRRTLQTQGLTASIARADLDWESGVLSALHRLDRAASDQARAGTTPRLDAAYGDFHAALIANCGMPLLISLSRMILDLNARYLNLFGPDILRSPEARADHTAIAHAAVARDGGLAADLLGDHLDRIGATLSRNLAAALDQTTTLERPS